MLETRTTVNFVHRVLSQNKSNLDEQNIRFRKRHVHVITLEIWFFYLCENLFYIFGFSENLFVSLCGTWFIVFVKPGLFMKLSLSIYVKPGLASSCIPV